MTMLRNPALRDGKVPLSCLCTLVLIATVCTSFRELTVQAVVSHDRGATGLQSRGGKSFSISGSVSPAVDSKGAVVSVSGPASSSGTVDERGTYTLPGIANGRYVVTASKEGYRFTPSAQVVTVNDHDVTGVDFDSTPVQPTYAISGVISPAPDASGVTLTLSGALSLSTTTDVSGNYSFSGLSHGSYIITPDKRRAAFTPNKQTVVIEKASVSGVNFAVAIRGSE